MILPILHASILTFFTMTIFFIVAQIKKDNSIVDIAWGIGFIQIALYTFYKNPSAGLLQYCVTALIVLWGLRLSTHITIRHSKIGEDPRYAVWRTAWQQHGSYYFYLRSFFQIFMLQGLVMLLVSLPVLAINSSMLTIIDMSGLCGLGIWIIGFLFEAVADYQLATFKKQHRHDGDILSSGLWYYSRHPNYFGESLMWWGIWLLSIHTGFALVTIISPVTITFLLLYVSGIPLAEKALSNNSAFQKYKSRTSAFIPLPPWQKNHE
jgi:steroid 5-alpha reductase family enzyme